MAKQYHVKYHKTNPHTGEYDGVVAGTLAMNKSEFLKAVSELVDDPSVNDITIEIWRDKNAK